MVAQISAIELHKLITEAERDNPSLFDLVFLLDVREPEEFAFTNINGSILIPMMEIEKRLHEIKLKLEDSKKTVIVCRSGQRSNMVGEYLHSLGFKNIYNLNGGINEYSLLDSSVMSY